MNRFQTSPPSLKSVVRAIFHRDRFNQPKEHRREHLERRRHPALLLHPKEVEPPLPPRRERNARLLRPLAFLDNP
jgi:hypothetical protein